MALAVAVSHAMLSARAAQHCRRRSCSRRRRPRRSAAGLELADDIDADDAWAVVRNVADQVEWDDAHDAGISTRPDAAERMTAELTTREQSELARLLQRELNRLRLYGT